MLDHSALDQTFDPRLIDGNAMSALRNRNVTLSDRRTSLRLEMPMWEGLEEICRREHQTLHEICTVIENQRGLLSLTAAVRVFILTYFRAAATEAGHKAAGHGKQPEHERIGQHARMISRVDGHRESIGDGSMDFLDKTGYAAESN